MLLLKVFVNAAKKLSLGVPIVVRLQGTNVDEAKAIIAQSEMKILSCDNLDEAAKLTTSLSEIIDLASKSNVKVDFSLPL
jgi:succinyl-CoA synthetase beta subunit